MREVFHIGKQRVAGFLSPEPVQGAVGQDAVEQHGQFLRGFVAVMLRQFQHAVLHDVQGGLLVADVVNRTFERSFLHAF